MKKDIGIGLGLRSAFYDNIINGESRAQWFEIISENYMRVPGLAQGHGLTKLLKVREEYPIALHGVSLSIGSVDDIDSVYIQNLKELIHIVDPHLVSDHLCWTSINGAHSHDLLPLPYTEECVKHVVNKIDQAQNLIGKKLAFENVSSYMTYRQSEMPEWEFVKEVATRSGCMLLLDINNVYVSGKNHNFNPKEYLDSIPWEHVAQVHLGGHFDRGDILIDTHDSFVSEDVWTLYRYVNKKFGLFSTMIEWDADFPTFQELESELQKVTQFRGDNNVTKRHPEPSL